MKTSEFNANIGSLGYYPDHREYFIYVKEPRTGDVKCTISKYQHDSILISTGDINLIKVCLDYAETPIHEREEVKSISLKSQIQKICQQREFTHWLGHLTVTS